MTNPVENLTVHMRADGDRYVCTWRVGRKQGIVYVTVNAAVDDKDVLAELCALHYLIEDVQLLGDNRSGANLQLTVSSPIIPDIQRGKSKKSHLYPFAVLLTTKFLDVPITVSKDCSWIGEGAKTRVRALAVSDVPTLSLVVKGHGTVHVRQHGFAQFRARLNHVNATDAWKEMQRVAKAGMVPVPNPERGSTKLYDPAKHWVWVVGDDGNLITAYTGLHLKKQAGVLL